MLIKIENLYYGFSDRILFDGLTHIFKPGVNIITGPNGTGKSTLLNIVAGNIKLSKSKSFISGDIKYYTNQGDRPRNSARDRDEIKAEDIYKSRLKYIGFIFQEEFLINSLTFEENLSLPLRFLGFSKKERSDILEENTYSELSEIFPSQDIQMVLAKKAGSLSGGEKKKLSILRAIITNPKILLIDEPTNHIDKNSIVWFVRLIEKLKKEGITIIMVTHSIEVQNMLLEFGVKVEQLILPFESSGHTQYTTEMVNSKLHDTKTQGSKIFECKLNEKEINEKQYKYTGEPSDLIIVREGDKASYKKILFRPFQKLKFPFEKKGLTAQ